MDTKIDTKQTATLADRSLRVLAYQMSAALTELSDHFDALPDADPAARDALARALTAAAELTRVAGQTDRTS